MKRSTTKSNNSILEVLNVKKMAKTEEGLCDKQMYIFDKTFQKT